jgi:hypothetical protein
MTKQFEADLSKAADSLKSLFGDALDGYDLIVSFEILRNITLSLTEYSLRMQFKSTVPDDESILKTEDRVKMALSTITSFLLDETIPFRIATVRGSPLTPEYLFNKAVKSNSGRFVRYDIVVGIENN